MVVKLDGTVHLLQSFFSVPLCPYSTDRRLFAFVRELPSSVLPPVAEIPWVDFAVRSSIYAVPRADHKVHVEGVTPSLCKSMPCERVRKLQEDRQNLACRGLTFVSPVGASHLLGRGTNIAEASCFLFPLLSSWNSPYDEALNWLQFAYMSGRMGAYMPPASTDLAFSALVEGGALFTLALWRLQALYLGSYAHRSTSTIGPLGLITKEVWR